MNDTIYFKTGYAKAVEIDSFNYNTIYYKYKNKKLDKIGDYTTTIRQVKSFVLYDEEGVKTYDSKMDYTGDKPIVKVDSLKVAEHDLSFNPFMIALLSPSVRYTWKFGNYMEYGVNVRMTYYNPILLDVTGGGSNGVFMLGAGFRFMPYYSRKFCFGMDFTPMLLTDFDEAACLLPISFDFDFYFGERVGIALDFGVGYVVGSGYTGFGGRGNLGFLFRLGNRYNVPNASTGVK